MKKLIAMLLALCVMAMMIPAMADNTDEGGSSLGALLGMVGDALNSSDDEDASLDGLLDAAGDDAEGGMAALLGMLSALGGGDPEAEPTYTVVPAASIEQFYGTWALSKVAIGSMEFPMEMLSLLGVEATGEIIIAENTISGYATFSDGSDSDETSKEIEVEMELADGALNVTVKGETATFQFTDAGELVCAVPGLGAAFFTPAE